MFFYPYAPLPKEDLLEVVDHNDRPLLLLPLSEALQKKMPHRKVRLVLVDDRGRLIMWRLTGANEEPQWGLLGTWVKAGESYENAALRVLIIQKCFNPETSDELELEKTLKMSSESTCYFKIIIHSEVVSELIGTGNALGVDLDELKGLMSYFTDMLHPELLKLVQNGQLSHLLSNAPSS